MSERFGQYSSTIKGFDVLCKTNDGEFASQLLALEPRVLFDGAAVATGAEVVEQATDHLDTGSITSSAPQDLTSLQDIQLLVALTDTVLRDEGENSGYINEIAFVDTGIENYQSVVASIGAGIEVILMDSREDGVEQIASALSERDHVDGILIFSHGKPGVLDLGTASLTVHSISEQYGEELAVIAKALSDKGDILIYGCNFGESAVGAEAVDALAQATGADVSASNDLTGSAHLGGDWDLEVQAGSIETVGFSGIDGNQSGVVDAVLMNAIPVLDNDGDDSSGQAGGDYETTFIENGPAVTLVDSDVAILDSDSDLITEATITLTNGQMGDVLNVASLPAGLAAISAPNPPGPLAAAGSIAVSIIGNGSRADYEAALLAITFQSNAEDSNETDRIVNIQVSENADLSNMTTTIIHVVEVNDRPVLDLDGNNSSGINAGNYRVTYSENGPALAIADIDTIVQDLDHLNLASAEITLTNGQIGDQLTVGALPAGISLVGTAPGSLSTAGSIVIQLTGSASQADYQTALQAVGFSSISDDPDTTQRIITVNVNDGHDVSNIASSFIDVLKANDAPVAVDDVGATDEDSAITVVAASGLIDVNDSDADDGDVLIVSAVNGGAGNVGNQITLASGALVTVHGDGSYVYDPNGAFEWLAVGGVPPTVLTIPSRMAMVVLIQQP